MTHWLIMREGVRARYGGDLRRRYIFDALLHRTQGQAIEFRGPLRRALLDLRGPRWAVWRRARVASAELLLDNQLENVRTLGRAVAVDIHDEPVLQAEALGVPFEPARVAELQKMMRANTETFRWLIAPSRPFAELAGLDLSRVIVAGNGTDTAVIRPEPWPTQPAIGFVSGAAPNRGIEELIEAVRRLRPEHPEVRLLLWLAATGDASAMYLHELRETLVSESWIEIGSAPYEAMSVQLGRATALVIPTPSHDYWDSVAPLKLYDALASGRPTVTTPRRETARVVDTHRAGLVTAGDSPDDLAAPLDRLLRDPELAQRLGANARAAAESDYDWRVIGTRLAEAILAVQT
ncbi:MAG: glycosyltransferase family 4 protein [Chloroflexota bacterium]